MVSERQYPFFFAIKTAPFLATVERRARRQRVYSSRDHLAFRRLLSRSVKLVFLSVKQIIFNKTQNNL